MSTLTVPLRHVPKLHPEFIPAVLWRRAYDQRVRESHGAVPVTMALERRPGDVSRWSSQVLPAGADNDLLTIFYLERTLKFLLWQKGGHRIYFSGPEYLAQALRGIYSGSGARQFDSEFIGKKVYGDALEIVTTPLELIPAAAESQTPLGRNWKGCRIGFDLGGSDRKCAAVVDGELVFSEEIPWDPYFQKDPAYHFEGIQDSLRRAAAKMPRVDAIGGSAAGIYVDNEPRVGSLFRGVNDADFARSIRPLFKRLREEWGGIPFEVINDGEVTALAGSVALNENAVLGISLGTSQAAGFVNPQGNITTWLNELAFAPVDYAADAPRDEWSGDIGCGVQYFSQQAVARLAPKAGIQFSDKMPFAERLSAVQEMMLKGDPAAESIYETIGTYLGYSIALYADFYDFRHLLLLGRVTSGPGGKILMAQARQVLVDEFPEVDKQVDFVVPDEKQKRHGQAVAAASLPA